MPLVLNVTNRYKIFNRCPTFICVFLSAGIHAQMIFLNNLQKKAFRKHHTTIQKPKPHYFKYVFIQFNQSLSLSICVTGSVALCAGMGQPINLVTVPLSISV